MREKNWGKLKNLCASARMERKANNQFWNFFSIESREHHTKKQQPKPWVLSNPPESQTTIRETIFFSKKRSCAQEEDVIYCSTFKDLFFFAAQNWVARSTTELYLFCGTAHITRHAITRELYGNRFLLCHRCEASFAKHFTPNLISVFYCLRSFRCQLWKIFFLIKVSRHYTIWR